MSATLLSNKFFAFISLIRLFSPAGCLLLFLPCVLGVGLYSNLYEYYDLILLFFIGSVVMRSAGCIINDIFDRNIDKYVERTKNRPIANNSISVMEAMLLFISLNAIGLLILLQLSLEARILGVIAAILYTTYPLMKRVTFFPQLFLGLAFNMGVLIASSHITGTITLKAALVYIGCIFWTLYYDTIYGFMDIKDDKKIGVKSLSIFIEKNHYKLWLIGFAILALFFITSGFLMTAHSVAAIMIAFILSAMLIMWQITTLKINLPTNCLLRFKSSNYLIIIWSLIAMV